MNFKAAIQSGECLTYLEDLTTITPAAGPDSAPSATGDRPGGGSGGDRSGSSGGSGGSGWVGQLGR